MAYRYSVAALLFALNNAFRFPKSRQAVFVVTSFTSVVRYPKRLFFSNAIQPSPAFFSAMVAPTTEEDPYIWLEEVESKDALNFAQETNAKCLAALGDPLTSGTPTYQAILDILESRDRIPHVTKYGTTPGTKDDILYNFWCDGNNPKGIWRMASLSAYQNGEAETEWTTVLDVDKLGKEEQVSWVWKGARHLPRARDPLSDALVTRALIFLSRGGADATVVREFDMVQGVFVEKDGFCLPKEAKTRASYKSRDVLFVGSDFGPDSLTDSGYPRTVREWVRGTAIEDAPTVFEGEKTDVSISTWIDDQRHRGGSPIYEVRSRSLTFYTAKYFVRKVAYEHLLAPNDPQRLSYNGDLSEFVEVDVQIDAEIDFFANLLIISLRSDWTLAEKTYIKGSLLCVDFDEFTNQGKEGSNFSVLFEPNERTALDTYSATKNYIILSVMENVRSKLVFLHYHPTIKIFIKVGEDSEARIRAAHVGGYDSYDNDKFWLTTSGFLQPSTLYMADATRAPQIPAESSQGDSQLDHYITQKSRSLPSKFDSSGFEAVQRIAVSKDSSEIPYFLVYKKGTKMDGNTPTLLYGYGGFEVSLTPHYISTAGAAWLNRGGAYVEANIRGGGEFGPKWHQAALKENRCKCYEDFIAVAEDLQTSGLCKPKTLGIRGGSNGGLLMGNMLVMRPDLFGAIACAVPLLDMKRYHLLLAGASWMAEYGDPSSDDWAKFLHKYSPYHNIDATPNIHRFFSQQAHAMTAFILAMQERW